MAAVDGTTLTVLIGADVVVCETSSSFNRTRDMIETTCKASGTSKTYIPGEVDGTIEVESVYDEAGTFTFDQAFTDMEAGTELTVKWGSVAAGSIFYTGTALISDLSADGPQNDRATWTMTLQLTGAVTSGTNPT